MKDTAVKFLIDEISCRFIISEELRIAMYKAIEMEKEQMIKFGKIVADKWGMIPIPLENIKDTYNETFKSE